MCSTLQQGAVATKQRLTVNIEPAEYEELQRLAKQHDVSMAWLARQAIVWFLESGSRQLELPLPLAARRSSA